MTYDNNPYKIRNALHVLKLMRENPEWFEGLACNARFREWIQKEGHLDIYHMFVRFAREAKYRGNHEFYSNQLIINRMRWETMISETDSQFKISQFIGAYLARVAMLANPDLMGMFKTHKTNEGENDE